MTKLCNKAETITCKPEITSEDIDLLACTLDSITEKLDLLHTLDEALIDAATDAECEDVLIEADDYTADIKETLAKFQ